jgi:hypothetical protein
MFPRLGITLLVANLCVGNAHSDVLFRCPELHAELQRDMSDYLVTLHIPATQVLQTVDVRSGELAFSLATAPNDTHTLDFHLRPEFSLSGEQLNLPAANGKVHVLHTVSKKEILLAMLQHGRVTTFKENACTVEALSDHVGVRQNIVAWAEHLHLVWPDGGPAVWNTKYWTRGTPNPGVSIHVAVNDVFLHQDKYSIGCYTAAKLVIVQGMLDYYSRIKRAPEHTRNIEQRLLADGDPLVGIEPGSMWNFEKDFDEKQMDHPGKLLKLHTAVAAGNFVPGDWGYILNTDPVTQLKTGYEGSNVIYLGRNLFDDFYDDHNHSYTYEQKLDEVYQWRNGVFSRSRDANKIKPLTAEEQAQLSNTPAAGGLQLDLRAVPRYF